MKQWYAAHLIVAGEPVEGDTDEWPIWENIVLIQAADFEEVCKKAEAMGHANYDGVEFTYRGRVSRWKFLGVRKAVTTANLIEVERGDEWIGEGTEVTYEEMVVKGKDNLEKLLAGESVDLRFERIIPEDW